MRFRQDVNTALAVGVFVVSSCVEHRSVRPVQHPPVAAPVSAPSPAPRAPDPAPIQVGYATYYARGFAGRRTANGERYDPLQLTAAHRTLPFGTILDVRRVDGVGGRIVVRVNDRGPYVSNRVIDLSRRAAEELNFVHEGKVRVELRVIPTSPTPLASVATGAR